jgi:hypothetical protein
MKICFADSGGFLALSSERDRRHGSALVRLADFGPFRQAGFEIVE